MVDFFRKIQDAARREGISGTSRKSREWFRKNVNRLGRGVSENEILKTKGRALSSRPAIGGMYLYSYNPKWKSKLPYYDRLPLTIVIERYNDGFLGVNMHYLPPKLRGEMMAAILSISSDNGLSDRRKLKLTYGVLKGSARLRQIKPAVKRYLYSHMKSRALRLEPDDWLPAVFLPLARFEKASNSKVWSDTTLKGRR